MDHLDAVVKGSLLDQCVDGAALAAVVHDDQTPIIEGLSEDVVECSREELLAILRSYDDGDSLAMIRHSVDP
ncbi:hypothetical protein GCM10009724_03060 [Microbacterium lacticum]|nr:hypothetical protein MLA01_11730 [Microbacterium lacticum]GGN13200.1 hypothetical protein GCM10009724_03060 [Microbacterium lacticum]